MFSIKYQDESIILCPDTYVLCLFKYQDFGIKYQDIPKSL